ncbi:MAG: hypothetical protein ACFN0X_03065 [Mitsuokella sp.]
MHGMGIIRRRTAIGKQPRMKGKTAICVDDAGRRLWLIKDVLQTKIDAIECCIPNDLSHVGEKFDISFCIPDFDGFNAGRVSKGCCLEVIVF